MLRQLIQEQEKVTDQTQIYKSFFQLFLIYYIFPAGGGDSPRHDAIQPIPRPRTGYVKLTKIVDLVDTYRGSDRPTFLSHDVECIGASKSGRLIG